MASKFKCVNCHIPLLRYPCPECGYEEVKQKQGAKERLIRPSERFKKEEAIEHNIKPSNIAESEKKKEIPTTIKPSDIANDSSRGIKITSFGGKRVIDVNETPAKSVLEIVAERNKTVDGEEKKVSIEDVSIDDLENVKREFEETLSTETDERYKKRVKSTLHEVVSLLEQLIRDD